MNPPIHVSLKLQLLKTNPRRRPHPPPMLHSAQPTGNLSISTLVDAADTYHRHEHLQSISRLQSLRVRSFPAQAVHDVHRDRA